MKNRYQPADRRGGRDVDETDLPEPRGMRWLASSVWRRVGHWVRANTFAPSWLPLRLRHPASGYILAVTLEVVAVTVVMLLSASWPEFNLMGLPVILVSVLVALHWGGAPSLVATLVGAVLLEFLVFLPLYSWSPKAITEDIRVGFILAVGLLISLVGGQVAAARRQADQARQEAEARAAQLHTIFETVVDGVMVYDQEGNIIEHNAAARAHLGMDQVPQSVSWTVADWTAHLAPRDAQGQPISLEQSPPYRLLRGEVLTGKAASDERLGTLDGREMFLSVTGAPIRNRQGQIIGAVLVGHDVTERHRLEQELAARVCELEAVIESITDAVMVCDAAGYPLRFNCAGLLLQSLSTLPADQQRPLSGYSAPAVVCDMEGRPLPPEQYPSTRVLRGEVLSGADSVDVMMQTLEGEPLYLNVSGAPLRDAEGKQVGAVLVGRDVTERRWLESRTQQALNALIQLAQTLVVEPAQEAALPVLLARRLAEFTREALGQERVTLVRLDPETRTLHPLVAVGLTPEQEGRWRATLEGTRRSAWFGPEVSARLDAGEVVQVEFAHPIYDQPPPALGGRKHLLAPLLVDQRLLGFLSVGRPDALPDFTAQEKALLGTVARLCALVLERERLLREREEARAQALALAEANKQMDTFLSIASHELKTPLTTIKLGFQLAQKRAGHLRRSAPDTIELLSQVLPQFQEQLALVEPQIKRLEWLVDDLLDVSRIQAGHLKLRLESADLVSIVQMVVRERQEAAPSRAILWRGATADRVPLQADAGRIGQVVTNYLTNALKYSPEDQPVEIGLEVQDQFARVWVRDAGPGIPTAEQERVWERFHRVPGIEVQTGSGVGLGIGLYISRTIIERHGGQVGVESTPGEGATFWFTLPLAPQHAHSRRAAGD